MNIHIQQALNVRRDKLRIELDTLKKESKDFNKLTWVIYAVFLIGLACVDELPAKIILLVFAVVYLTFYFYKLYQFNKQLTRIHKELSSIMKQSIADL